MSRFVARPSLPRLIFLLLGSFLFVAGGFWIAGFVGAPPRPGREWLGWITTIFFGACAAAIVPRLFDRGDQIVVDADGIYCKRWSELTIPWEEVKDVREANVRGSRFMCFKLEHPKRYLSSTVLGRFSRLNEQFGFGDLSIGTIGTDRRFEDLERAVFAHWTGSRRS